MNQYLSRSAEFDRPEHYQFVRDTKLPRGTFGHDSRAPWVWAAVILVAVVGAFLLVTK